MNKVIDLRMVAIPKRPWVYCTPWLDLHYHVVKDQLILNHDSKVKFFKLDDGWQERLRVYLADSHEPFMVSRIVNYFIEAVNDLLEE